MSAESLQAVADAIAAHLTSIDSDNHPVLTDWFVAFGSMRHDSEASEGIAHGLHYVTSPSSPQGVLGVALLGVGRLEADLAPEDE